MATNELSSLEEDDVAMLHNSKRGARPMILKRFFVTRLGVRTT